LKLDDGKCIIVSAPSGAGKTTIVRHLLSLGLGLEFSVSACSREKRNHEVEGKDYYFLDTEVFKTKIGYNEFLEWEEVYPNQFYGTLRSEIQRIWDKDNLVIFDVDVVGGLNLKKIFGDQALAIFVMPPSVEVLATRLRSRDTESKEKINLRLQKAEVELETAHRFDKVVVNDDLIHALGDAERLISDFIERN